LNTGAQLQTILQWHQNRLCIPNAFMAPEPISSYDQSLG